MGFFGKILNGLGFYSDDDLKHFEEKKQAKIQKKVEAPNIQSQKTTTQSDNIHFFVPSTQADVVEIVNMLKNGISARVDLKMFDGEDLIRATDFLQGACYALKIEPVFENNTTILLKQ